MKMRYVFRFSLVLFLIISLFSCNRATFTPAGEIYAKTSPSRGDAGVGEVVDITIEEATYSAEGEITVPVQIGVGHSYRSAADGRLVASLKIEVWLDTETTEEPAETKSFDYPDWGSDKYISTEPEQRPWNLFWLPVYYGQFYPLYHETFMWTIPADVTSGYLKAYICKVDTANDNTYTTEAVWIQFERVDGNVVFSAA